MNKHFCRVCRCIIIALAFCFTARAQVDTLRVYNPKHFIDANGKARSLDIRIAESSTRYWYLQHGQTFSYRSDKDFYAMDPFATWANNFEQGNLRYRNDDKSFFVMNYRMARPLKYDSSYKKGYPLILFLHGAGERGNCWGDDCYYGNRNWRPDPPTSLPPSGTSKLLNNDHPLSTTGFSHYNAIQAAEGKLPDDKTISDRGFPGFVLIPQNLNGWDVTSVQDAIRLVRLFAKKFNIDPDRIYIHGLSDGGQAVHNAIKLAPWLFTSAAMMSATGDGGNTSTDVAVLDDMVTTPLWLFQGQQDTGPSPSFTKSFQKKYTDAGFSVRYTEYPGLRHGIWSNAYSEPDFFSWFLSRTKADITVKYQIQNLCSTPGFEKPIALRLSKGFFAYEWEKDGTIISGANSYELLIKEAGVYRARFSRVPNPQPSDWNTWSQPVVINSPVYEKPELHALTSTHLGLPFPVTTGNRIEFESSTPAQSYAWFRNNNSIPNATSAKLSLFATPDPSGYDYIALQVKHNNCPGPVSDPVRVFFAPDLSPVNIVAPLALSGSVLSSRSILLKWKDVTYFESGYEIWRRVTGESSFSLVKTTGPDVISFIDKGLMPGTPYEYKIRAISNAARSNFVPGNPASQSLKITTSQNTEALPAPQNLVIEYPDPSSVKLSWDPLPERFPIANYQVNLSGSSITVDRTKTTTTITGLQLNSTLTITVQARDRLNQLSPFSNQVTADFKQTGLHYEYSGGAYSSIKEVNWSGYETKGVTQDFNLNFKLQEDYFAVKFDGYINIDSSGTYQFQVNSNDGTMLYLDGFNPADLTANRIINNDYVVLFATSTGFTSAPMTIATGPHRIVLLYFEFTGADNVSVQYKGPDTHEEWTTVDSSVLKSSGIPSITLDAPQLQPPTPLSYDKVNLSWKYNGGPDEFEIYRAEGQQTNYTIIQRVRDTTFTDSLLLASTTYRYKIRAVNKQGLNSELSNPVTVTTKIDVEPPSVPGNVKVVELTSTNAIVTWEPSTDNNRVRGYSVFVNDVFQGESESPVFELQHLEPATMYTVNVWSIDVQGVYSIQSASLTFKTESGIQATFYSKATGDLNQLNSWATLDNRTPVSFDMPGQYFILANRKAAEFNTDFILSPRVSRLVVSEGTSVTFSGAFVGDIDVKDKVSIEFNDKRSIPVFKNVAPSSYIHFNNQSLIPSGQFGDVSVSGSQGTRFAQGTTHISGSLVVSDNTTIAGGEGSTSTLIIGGDVNVGSGVSWKEDANLITLIFEGKASHQLFPGSVIRLRQLGLDAQSTVVVQGNSGIIEAGSYYDGGVVISDGSYLDIGANHLKVIGAGSINANNATGTMGFDGGQLTLESSAVSHLYVSKDHSSLSDLSINLSEGQVLNVHDDVWISNNLKILHGQLSTHDVVHLISQETLSASVFSILNNGVIDGKIELSIKGKSDVLSNCISTLPIIVAGFGEGTDLSLKFGSEFDNHIIDATLIDWLTGTQANMLASGSYDFTMGDPLLEDRFEIQLSVSRLNVSAQLQMDFNPCEDQVMIFRLKGTQPGVSYYLTDESGNTISATAYATTSLVTFEVDPSLLIDHSEVRVIAKDPACGAVLFPSRVEIDSQNQRLKSPSTQSAVIFCPGGDITLFAGGASSNEFYEWLDADFKAIASEPYGILHAGIINDSARYYVRIVSEFGCQSDLVPIDLLPLIPRPQITFNDQLLYIQETDNRIQWYRDDELLIEQTGSSLHPDGSGVYKVIISKLGCRVAGELSVTLPPVLVVYPNPVNTSSGEFLTIELDEPKPGSQVNLLDAEGNSIWSQALGSQGNIEMISFTIQGLAPGRYYAIYQTSDGRSETLAIQVY